jgi:glycosyltransferase involved in cell wall biosynthesis
MTRIGINPARGKDTNYRPSRVTVAMITYIPHLSGYFKHRLQVLQLSLSSLIAHTTHPCDLLVFDNGSCQPVIDYLQQLRDSKIIDYLLLSRSNIGKIGAFNILFNAAPGEIVAYSDDDILFYPGWLEAHLEIIEKFPHVGMVTGLPVRDASDRARNSLDQLIANVPEGLTISIENNIPEEWEVDWALSTGRNPHIHLEKIRQKEYVTLSYKGVEAFGWAICACPLWIVIPVIWGISSAMKSCARYRV